MKVFLAGSFSDEEGPLAEEGKTVYILGSKEKLLELFNFLNKSPIILRVMKVATCISETHLSHGPSKIILMSRSMLKIPNPTLKFAPSGRWDAPSARPLALR